MDNINKNNSVYNLEILVYGRIELMIMKYCLLNKFLNKDKACSLCKNNKEYKIKADNKELYPLIGSSCLSKLLHSRNIDLLNDLEYYKTLGITNFRIDLYDESELEIEKILTRLEG